MRLALISNMVTGIVTHIPEITRQGHVLGLFIPEALFAHVPANPSVTRYSLPSLPDIFHKHHRILAVFPIQIPLLLDKFRPDIVHFENPQLHLFFPVFYWCKIHHKPIITSASDPKPSFINKGLYTLSDFVYNPADKTPYVQILSGLLHR